MRPLTYRFWWHAWVALALATCGGDAPSRVTLDLRPLHELAALGGTRLDRVEVRVEAPDLGEPLVAGVDRFRERVELEVPAGPARRFLLHALHEEAGTEVPVYWGESAADLEPGAAVELVMFVYRAGELAAAVRVVPPQPLPAHFALELIAHDAVPELGAALALPVVHGDAAAPGVRVPLPVGDYDVLAGFSAGGTTYGLPSPLTLSVLQGVVTPATVWLMPPGSKCAPYAPTEVREAAPACRRLAGRVEGLRGAGLVLARGAERLAIAADGAFAFAGGVADGAAWEVRVGQEPAGPRQRCSIHNAAGVMAGTDVAEVVVSCAVERYFVGGVVSGLAGSGLLLGNGDEVIAVSSDGSFGFANPVDDEASYDVLVLAQPIAPEQACTVAGGSGLVGGANVDAVSVACSTYFTVGGSVSGLAGVGLALQNHGAELQPIGADGRFAFALPVLDGGSYEVTVATQPVSPSQTCTVHEGAGIVDGAPIESMSVTCSTNHYSIGGITVGLDGAAVILALGTERLALPADGVFAFPTPLLDGEPYEVRVAEQPVEPRRVCTVTNGGGVLAGVAVAEVEVACAPPRFVAGVAAGLGGEGLVLALNGGETLAVAADGAFAFATALVQGAGYEVRVVAQPPHQVCGVGAASGTIGDADVSTVTVGCGPGYALGGQVSGLLGAGLVLQNAGEVLAVGADGGFTFAGALAAGVPYAVSVAAAPSGPRQSCTIANGEGTMPAREVVELAVTCTTERFRVGGSVAGESESVAGLVLRSGDASVAVAAPGSFAFAEPRDDGSAYEVTVEAQPRASAGGEPQCTVLAGAGKLAGADAEVRVVCLGPVGARYPFGERWNDYVRASSPALACDGSEAGGYRGCIHGGPARALALPGYASCERVAARDALGAFDWSCDAGTTPVSVVSSLRAGVRLSDLLELGAAPRWRPNAVTVTAGEDELATAPAAWWSNPVEAAPAGPGLVQLDHAGSVYVLAADAFAAYEAIADHVAFVVAPGAAVLGTMPGAVPFAAYGRRFLWLEGRFQPTFDPSLPAVLLSGTSVSVLRGIDAHRASSAAGVALQFAFKNHISGLRASQNAVGLSLESSSENLIEDVVAATNESFGIEIVGGDGPSSGNVLTRVTAFNNAVHGIGIASAADNRLAQVASFHNGGAGIYGSSCQSSVFLAVTAASNGGAGVELWDSADNDFAALVAVNGPYGVLLQPGSRRNTFTDAVVAGNDVGFELEEVSANRFTGMLAIGNATTECLVIGPAADPGLIDGTCSDTGEPGSSGYAGQLSDAALAPATAIAHAFVGPVDADDARNGSDTDGVGTAGSITDWVGFDGALRGWGIDAPAAFPHATLQGSCAGACRVWDFTLRARPSLLRATLAPPRVGEDLVHAWSDGSTTAFVRHALELDGDRDGLCEAGERCLYTPNLGAYQGHGLLREHGGFWEHALNGR